MDNPIIPCEQCNRDVPFDDYIRHVELCRHRNAVLNLLNPMLNTFLNTNNNVIDDDVTFVNSIEDLVDEYQMNNIISEMIGIVHHGVNDIDDALTSVESVEIDKDIDKCSICLDDFEGMGQMINSNDVVKTKCNHFFCRKCIVKWFTEHNKCPLCLFDFNI